VSKIKRFLRSTTGWAIILCLLAVIISGALPWLTKAQTSEWEQPGSSGNMKFSWSERGVDAWPGALQAGVSLAVCLVLIAAGFNERVTRWQSFLVTLTGMAALALVGLAFWTAPQSRSTRTGQQVTTTSSSFQFGIYAAGACALGLVCVGVLQFRACSKHTVAKSDYLFDDPEVAGVPEPVTTDWDVWKSDWKKLFRTPAGWAKFICILGLGASLLPWAQVLWLILNGFSTWHGLATTAIYLLLLAFLGVSERRGRLRRWRAFMLVLAGVAITALSLWFLWLLFFPPQPTASRQPGAGIVEALLKSFEGSLSASPLPIGPIINLGLGIGLLVFAGIQRWGMARPSEASLPLPTQ
jgi:multisubunit Na+/H+ antiporter MnhB subunit